MRKPWGHIQASLFPEMREELDPLTEKLERLIHILDDLDLEAVVRMPLRGQGRTLQDRTAIARAFVAKAVLGLSTTRDLLDRLQTDRTLRRICGWERRDQIPSESTFSRAFDELARDQATERLHADLVRRGFDGHIVGHVARDATDIDARERPPKDPPDDPGAPPPKPKRPRGRPRKGEEPPPKPKTRLERQLTQSVAGMFAELPRHCSIGTKRNSKGHTTSWIGYKLHLDVADSLVPVSALVTSASLHDSQVAIPLARITAQRVSYLYELMDAAYDAKAIVENSRMAGRIPLIDSNPRSGKEAKAERATERRRRDCLNLSDAKDQRYNERTNAERAIGRLKDEFGGQCLRVRGHLKVACHLGFGILALTAESLIRLRAEKLQAS
jgi:hypothetical protein